MESMNILSHFIESVEKFSDRNAFCINNKFHTYSEFAKIVSCIKSYISDNPGITSENSITVGVSSYDEIETYASFYAIMFSGLTFVPIDPANPVDRNSMIVEMAGIRTILTCRSDDNINKMQAEFKNVKFVNTRDLIASKSEQSKIDLRLPASNPDNAAYILFTSGSTGVPKGVPISNRNLNAFMDAFFALGYEIDENDRFLQPFSLLFDLSIMSYMIPLTKGSCVYPLPEEGIKYVNIYSIFEEHEITFALMVPSVLSYLRPFFNDIRLEKMRYSMFCGEAVYGDILNEWSNCVPNALVQNVYGPTEATIFCLTYDWSRDNAKHKIYTGIVSIGKPMKNMGAVIIDENNNILPQNEKGELCLSGHQLTSGYLKNPEKNKSAFFKKVVDGEEIVFYKTGDVAYRDEEDDFMYCGRIDYQIKIQGYRIELGEIEHHARGFLKDNNVVAAAIKNNSGTLQIHLFIENYTGNVSDVENYLKSKIPGYMVPAYITNIASFPLNDNGKTDRKKLALMGQEFQLQSK